MKERAPNQRLRNLICLALGLITLALYLPSLRHDFIEYDDQEYVTSNAHVRAGLTIQGLFWAFGQHASNWHPMTWLSHMLDCQIFDLNPFGHHLTSVLLHVANTLLLFVVLNRMTGGLWRSALVAALFAWHPLHVESVAWVAERKDVLSAFFWMLTLWSYIRYVEERGAQIQHPISSIQSHASRITHHASRITHHASCDYALTLVFFALALMSKPMAVTLPFVLLLLDYWPLQRLQLRTQNSKLKTFLPLVWEKLPFFLLSAITCVLTISAQRQAYSIISTAGLAIPQRVAHALISYLHYIEAMFVPRHLAVYYPYEAEIPVLEIVFAALLLGLITLLVFRLAAARPYLLVGWLWYLGTLVPVIGLVQVGDQAWADRYTYLPLIGLFVALVWGGAELMAAKLQAPSPKLQGSSKSQAPKQSTHPAREIVLLQSAVVALMLALIIGTSVQLRHWKNTRTLFEHAARVTRNNHVAITVLGSLLAKEGKIDEAIEHYRIALSYRPRSAEAHFFLGNALDQQGKIKEAIAEYDEALRSKPMQEQTHIFLGIALAKEKKYDRAADHYVAALELNPESAVAHNNFARLLQTQGRLDEAMEHYSAALKFDPNLAQAHNNLGILLLQKGNLVEGTRQLREALRLNSANPETRYNLALALNQQGQWSEAVELFEKTVGTAFTDPNAHYQFARALGNLNQTRDAMSQYARALIIQPDFPEALDGLSWILATASNAEFRNGTEAVRMAERACELTGRKDPQKLKTLAAAYAEAGRFEEAMASAQKAQELAASAGREELAKESQRMLENFTSAKPWRRLQPEP